MEHDIKRNTLKLLTIKASNHVTLSKTKIKEKFKIENPLFTI